MANYYYSGQGSLLIAERDETATPAKPKALRKVGNVSELTINIETTKLEHKESESGSRLIDLTITQEKKGTFSFNLENLDPINLALAFWGESAVVAAGTDSSPVVYDVLTGTSGEYIMLEHSNVTGVVVTGPSATPTYVEDTDYTLDSSGNLYIVPGGAIATACASADITIEVTSTWTDYIETDAFTTSAAPTRWLRFVGINTVDDTPVIVDMFKGQFDPVTGYALINDEVGSVTVNGNIVADLSRTSDSKFFRQRNDPSASS